jgi:hypothetical protein
MVIRRSTIDWPVQAVGMRISPAQSIARTQLTYCTALSIIARTLGAISS